MDGWMNGLFARVRFPISGQVLCISMCPCCIGPYCSTERKSTYVKVMKTASFILSVLQLILVIASLCDGGMAPPGVRHVTVYWSQTSYWPASSSFLPYPVGFQLFITVACNATRVSVPTSCPTDKPNAWSVPPNVG
jgi:hypothetical protein